MSIFKKHTHIKAVVAVGLLCTVILGAVGVSMNYELQQEPKVEEVEEVVVEDTPAEDVEVVEEEAVEEDVIAEPAPVVSNNGNNYNNNYSRPQQQTQNNYVSSGKQGVLTKQGGVNWYNGRKETYYNLDMSGVIKNAQNMGIQGNYWVRDDGVKMYGEHVIVASQDAKGSIVETSLGTGIVLDYCPAGTVDVAVTW